MAEEIENPGNPTGANPGDASEAVDAAERAASDAAESARGAIPDDADESTLNAAAESAAEARALAEAAGAPAGSRPLDLPQFLPDVGERTPEEIELLGDVNLNVKIELGRTRMLVEDVLRLGSGAVVELDKLAGDPVDVFVNDRLVARGEVLVLNDNFCVRISQIISVEGKPRD